MKPEEFFAKNGLKTIDDCCERCAFYKRDRFGPDGICNHPEAEGDDSEKWVLTNQICASYRHKDND